MKAFFDTNILLYASGGEGEKQDRAKACLAGGGVASVQVLNEFVSVSRRKMKRPWSEIETELDLIRALDMEVVAVTLAAHEAGVAMAWNHHLNIYDAVIIASAQQAGCDVLWTEDMDDGRRMDRLTIRNPFKSFG